MEVQSQIESVSKSDLMGLQLGSESWNQSRSTEQLLNFITRREAEIFSTEA